MNTTESLWQQFAEKNGLSQTQQAQFELYYKMLIAENELFNITAITDLESVITYHFEDSLYIKNFINFFTINSICDVGTGGGFPGIPLKILFPHLQVTLLEVNLKKVNFLHKVIEVLYLENIQTCDLDWRTFLRKSTTPIDLFCSRASLHPDELIRLFSPITSYQKSTLVYWAASEWTPTKKEEPYVQTSVAYAMGSRKRKYCIFSV